jgi:hypothetical protein
MMAVAQRFDVRLLFVWCVCVCVVSFCICVLVTFMSWGFYFLFLRTKLSDVVVVVSAASYLCTILYEVVVVAREHARFLFSN